MAGVEISKFSSSTTADIAQWLVLRSSKPEMPVRVWLSAHIAAWCNGSTTDFGSVSIGSTPVAVTKGES